ncbi:hypothetical protein E8F11_23540 [Pseudomonas sp. BN417]|uniref:hypothetical protein n=1 Tax=Pseudomonas sp. BN417 TaxID=2567890 RepID=UPI002458DC3B|nr:hypothetical protein [Pseudomonas sp. BN417]MDH4558111.1 hypothetical protein [Pseudomonas sp. BN417]
MVAFAQVIKYQLGQSRAHGLTDWSDAQQRVAPLGVIGGVLHIGNRIIWCSQQLNQPRETVWTRI